MNTPRILKIIGGAALFLCAAGMLLYPLTPLSEVMFAVGLVTFLGCELVRAHIIWRRTFWKRFFRQDPAYISIATWVHADKLARQWPTCACGEQDPRIPRWDEDGDAEDWLSHPPGSPKDGYLKHLGQAFCDAIGEQDFDDARIIFRAIEKRAGDIMAGHPSSS